MEEVRSSDVSPRQLQVKTKSIFPKEREANRTTYASRAEKERRFRFPVVPDDYQVKPPLEHAKAAEPVRQAREPERSADERDIQRRELPARTGDRIPVAKDETGSVTRMPARAGRDHRQAERRGEEETRQVPRTSRTQAAGVEKRVYKPSDIVSPVYGKITPSTHEEKHRIHTTAGIVYPRLEQEELLNQLKQRGQLQPETDEGGQQAAAAGEAVAEAQTGEEPLVLDSAEQRAAEQAEEASSRGVEADWLAAEQLEQHAEPLQEEGLLEEQQEGQQEEQQDAESEVQQDAQPDGNLPDAPTKAAEEDMAVVEAAQQGAEPDEQLASASSLYDEPAPSIWEYMENTDGQGAKSGAWEAGHDGLNGGSSALASDHDEPDVERNQAEVERSRPDADRNQLKGEGGESASTHRQQTYVLPSLDLLNPSPPPQADDDEHTQLQKLLLEETLVNFNVSAQVVGIVKGPSVTRFELQPAPGVKVNKITSLVDDIKLNLAAKDIRIEAPIPGRNAIGIEVPNLTSQPVLIEKIIGSKQFQEHPSPLAVALGMDIGGEPIVADIKKMPHGLIAGATGSGKSVCINSIIVSLLFKATPEQVRLLLIDPKMVELAPYNHLPHLVTPVVTEAKQATAALKWAVEEMEKRYALFVEAGVRDIERYNQTTDHHLPYIVIVIDELADLMMVSPQDVEDCIIRIAQKARACGIHLLLATQRPSVDVITGNIKANVPTRLAFAVFSQVDSRTILDQSGAERLLGRGDMLFLESGTTPVRLQGNFVSDDEIERITQMIKRQRKPSYFFSKEDLEHQAQSFDSGDDPLYLEALVFVAEQGQASASGLQRRFRIGYNRAARLIEMMEADGYVSGQNGGKARTVLITPEDAQALYEGSTLV